MKAPGEQVSIPRIRILVKAVCLYRGVGSVLDAIQMNACGAHFRGRPSSRQQILIEDAIEHHGDPRQKHLSHLPDNEHTKIVKI